MGVDGDLVTAVSWKGFEAVNSRRRGREMHAMLPLVSFCLLYAPNKLKKHA